MGQLCFDSQYNIALYEEELGVIQKKYRRKRMREALIGPLISTVFHILLLVALYLYGTDLIVKEYADIQVNLIANPELSIEEPPVEQPVLEEDLAVQDAKPELSPLIKLELEKLDFSLLDNLSDEEPSTADRVINDTSLSDVILSMSAITDNISGGHEDIDSAEEPSFHSAGNYSQRNKEKRIIETVKNGGTMQGQQALQSALWWLAKVQNPDGSWGNKHKRAMTGLAVLTFLAHGDTHLSRHFGGNVKRAFKWLIDDEVSAGHGKGYGHAIKTYAICEAYAMTALNDLEAPMEACVKELIDGQQINGAFDYNLRPDSTRQDTSVTGWGMQALKSAYVAGSQNEKLIEAIEKGLNWLQIQCASPGSFPYSIDNGNLKGSGRYSMRAIGALCLQLFGKEDLASLQDEFKKISEDDIKDLDWAKAPSHSLYTWYYSTQSVFQLGGALFKNWNEKMETMLVDNQEQEGYWIYPGGRGGTQNMDTLTARIYATTLCSLTLTVYYRYLPTYKGLAKGHKEAPEAVAEVELIDAAE